MITVKQILVHIQLRDWFMSVDLKDAYFHIKIAPCHRHFLKFSFEYQLLDHLQSLGQSKNVKKSVMWTCLSQGCVQSMLRALAIFKPGRSVSLKCFQRLLGLMVAVAVMCRLGLLHMRPLQLWLKAHVPRQMWQSGQVHVIVTHSCMHTLSP